MAQPGFTTTLTEAVPRTSDTMSFRLARPAGFGYVAGQWFTITVPSPDGPLPHHFTFSSSPTEPFLEFTTRMTGSPFKNAMLALKPGAVVEMIGPYGSFTLPAPDTRMACLMGGIGVTPLRSWLRFLTDTGDSREMTVLYGSMTEEGILFRDELEEMASRMPACRIVHVVANPPADWTGRSGFITAEIIRAELADPLAWTHYVCGPPPMVAVMQPLLDGLGIPPAQVVVERFSGYQE